MSEGGKEGERVELFVLLPFLPLCSVLFSPGDPLLKSLGRSSFPQVSSKLIPIPLPNPLLPPLLHSSLSEPSFPLSVTPETQPSSSSYRGNAPSFPLTMSSSTDLPFDKSKAQRTMDSERTMFSTSPPRQTIPIFSNQPLSPQRSTSYSSPPSKNNHNKETSYSSVSSTSHENEQYQQRLAQEQEQQRSSYPMQDFGSAARLPKEQLDEEDLFQPPRPAYQQPLNSGSADGGSVRSGNESSDDGLTATDSEDEFDWDEDDALEKEKEDATGMVRGKHRAKRGRRVYLWLMSLSRWFRYVSTRAHGREGGVAS